MQTKLKTQQQEEYKQTELGLLPKEWKVVRLGDLIIQSTKKNTSNKEYMVYTISNKFGFITSDEFFNKRVYSKKLVTYKIVKKYDFAYNPYRINVGSVGLFTENIGLVSPAYIVFKIKEKERLFPHFLFRLIKSPFYMSEIKRFSMSRGSVRRSLSFKDLSNFKIPLPPLQEQKAIAFVLSTIQTAKEKTEQVIQATKELKKSLMKHLFTYGPVSLKDAEKVKLKETEIGKIPEGWDVVRLGDVVEKTQYGLSKRADKKGKYPILRMNNMVNGNINISDLKYIDLDDEDFTKFKLNKGDILFNRTNSLELVGKTSIFNLELDCVFASYLIRLKLNFNKILPEFLNYYMNIENTQINLKKLASRGVSQSNISATKLKTFKIPLPPLQIQKKIASILSAVDEKIEKEENKKKALEELFKSMLYNLMSAKIRVKDLKIISV